MTSSLAILLVALLLKTVPSTITSQTRLDDIRRLLSNAIRSRHGTRPRGKRHDACIRNSHILGPIHAQLRIHPTTHIAWHHGADASVVHGPHHRVHDGALDLARKGVIICREVKPEKGVSPDTEPLVFLVRDVKPDNSTVACSRPLVGLGSFSSTMVGT